MQRNNAVSNLRPKKLLEVTKTVISLAAIVLVVVVFLDPAIIQRTIPYSIDQSWINGFRNGLLVTLVVLILIADKISKKIVESNKIVIVLFAAGLYAAFGESIIPLFRPLLNNLTPYHVTMFVVGIGLVLGGSLIFWYRRRH